MYLTEINILDAIIFQIKTVATGQDKLAKL